MQSRKLFLLFLPAIILGGFGLFVQIIRYEPQFPKEDAAIKGRQGQAIPIFPEDPIIGSKQAPTAIVAFEDLGCQSCQEQMRVLTRLAAEHPKKIKIIWKGLPITRFPAPSTRAHAYAFCANEQKKIGLFLDAFLASGDALKDESLANSSRAADLDAKDLDDCLTSGRPEMYQSKTEVLADALQIQAVPAVFIDNKQIQTPSHPDGWKTLLGL